MSTLPFSSLIAMETHFAERLDKHIIEANRHFCQSVEGGTFVKTRNWVRGYTGSTTSTFNSLLLLTEKALDDDLLSDAAAFFNERRVPHVVAFDEHRLPSASQFLHARSYQPLPPQPGMVLLGPPRRLPSHPQLAVEPVRSPAAIGIYCSLVSELFGLLPDDVAHLFPARQLQDRAFRHYLGYLEDVPVAVGTGVLVQGIISVWNVATQDHCRRQGVATAIMLRLLQDAWDDGCDASVLYSTPMAYSMYQRLGYVLYTQRRSFLPPEW